MFKSRQMTFAMAMTIALLYGCGEFDKEPPVIRLIGLDTLNLGIGETFTDPGAIAFDKRDLDISDDIQLSGDISSTQLGYQEVRYTVTDRAGNTGTAKRFIRIVQSVASLSGLYTSSNNCGLCTGNGTATISAFDPLQRPKTLSIRPAVGSVGSSALLLLNLDSNGNLTMEGTTSSVCGLLVSKATGKVNEVGDSIWVNLQFVNGTFCTVIYTR
jgi:hypothetical protein